MRFESSTVSKNISMILGEFNSVQRMTYRGRLAVFESPVPGSGQLGYPASLRITGVLSPKGCLFETSHLQQRCEGDERWATAVTCRSQGFSL
jgi:hypothetical protein